MPKAATAPAPAAPAPAATPASAAPAAAPSGTKQSETPSSPVTQPEGSGSPTHSAKEEGAMPSWMDQASDELSALDDQSPAKPAKEKKPAGDETKTRQPATKPEEGETIQPGSETPPSGEAPPKPIKAAELRTAYESLKKEKAEVLQPTIQKLEARIRELESANPEEITKPLQEKLSAIEKRNKELEDHIQFVDYTRSSEFADKYQKPYAEAWTRAVGDFQQLTVKIDKGENPQTGEPVIETRQANADDLLYLANLPLSEMDSQAEAMFGKSAPRVIRHVEKVRELSEAQNRAIADAQKRGGERHQQQSQQAKEIREKQNTLFKQYNTDLATRFPKMFGPEDGDDEGNALLKKGQDQADILFYPNPNNQPKTPEQMVQLHAIMRNKIANHDRLVLRLKRVNAELEETKKALAEYESSTPPGGKAGSSKPAAKSFQEEIDAEIQAMDKA